MSIEKHLSKALEIATEAIKTCEYDDRLRQRLEAEAALISATFGLITGDSVDEARKEWNEAADDFA